MCRFCYGFVRWNRWDYHSLDPVGEAGITYLAATNAGWLPYLVNEGMRFVHYPTNRVKRQFGLDQDIPDAISFLMESPHFCPTLSAAHYLWILESEFYCSYHSRLTEGRSLYPYHAWILAGRDDFMRKSWWVVVVSPLFLLMGLAQLSQLILDYFCLLSLC